jgi:hypothetical protein
MDSIQSAHGWRNLKGSRNALVVASALCSDIEKEEVIHSSPRELRHQVYGVLVADTDGKDAGALGDPTDGSGRRTASIDIIRCQNHDCCSF